MIFFSDISSTGFTMTDSISVHQDTMQFDECQLGLVDNICRSIKAEIEKLDIDVDRQMELTTQIAFSVCCILDGSTKIERNGVQIRPCLTFSLDEAYAKLLATNGATSCHEYAVGFSEDLFME